MRVCFVAADQPRERLLGEAIIAGAKAYGDDAWMVSKTFETEEILKQNADVYGMVGVKSKRIFHDVLRAGAHALMLDKGYTRHRTQSGPSGWEYWRVCVDCQHPTSYLLDQTYPPDRFRSWGKEVQSWRLDGGHIVFAGSSEKYHDFHGLPHPTEYAAKVCRRIWKATKRKVIYRPKPSWRDAVPVDGAQFSGPGESIASAMTNAWCLVTHGSNAAIDAVLAGIPCVVLGDGAARPISSTEIDDAAYPRMASSRDVNRWLAALAYAQFTIPEIASGMMWQQIRPRIVGA